MSASGGRRVINAIPAGAEDSDSDDDIFMGNQWGGSQAGGGALPPSGAGSKPTSTIAAPSNENQRSSHDASSTVTKTGQNVRESAVEEFRMAVAASRIDAAMAMLHGLDPNSVSRSGWSPLMFAAEAGEVDICKKLLELGANPNYHIDNFSVLMAASRCRGADGVPLQMVKLLVEEHGVTTSDAKDRYHSTPLMYAAMEGHVDVVRYLIEHCKVAIDSYDARGHTALMLAVRRGQLEVSRVLLEAGADREKMNVDGKTAKEMSMDSGNVAIINLLNNKNTHVSALDSFNEVSRFGEMESFFYGLQLHELINVFKEQNVEFKQLLLLSESDLLHMGVKVGDVKKVSEAIHAIHKQPWNKSSLHKFDLKTRNVLKCSEAVAVVENISKHTSLMCSSIGYVADQVRSHDSVMESGIDNGAALKLHTSMNEAAANCRALLKEIDRLKHFFHDKDFVNDLLIPVDRISTGDASGRKRKDTHRRRTWLLKSAGAAVGASLVLGVALGVVRWWR